MLLPLDANNINSSATLLEEVEPDDNQRTSSDAADDVATSHHTNDAAVSPVSVTVDDTIAVFNDSDAENPGKTDTPTSPKDGSGTHVSMFSKRSGITPSTPPVKDTRSKKSLVEPEVQRPKRKGCCAIV